MALLTWWWNELRECGESLLTTIAPQLITRTFITLDRTGGSVSTLRGKEQKELLAFSSDASRAWPRDLGPFGPREVIENTRAVFALAPEFVLIHRMVLPEKLERDLDRVVPLQLERELPMRRDRISFDWRLASR